MSLLKKLAGETAIYGVSSILGRLLNYVILTPYLTRVFSPVEYGAFSDLYAYVAFLMVLLTFRMETTFFRYGRSSIDMDRAFSTAGVTLIGTSILFLASALWLSQEIATLLTYPSHPEYIIWLAVILVFDTLAALPFARLRLENRPVRFAMIKVANIVINILFIFVFLEILTPWGQRAHYPIFADSQRLGWVFVANLIASGATHLMLIPTYRRIRWRFDATLWPKMMNYAAPLVIAGFAGVINQLVGVPMIKWLASENLAYNKAQMGIYSAAAKVAVLMNLFTQAFNYAAEPFFFRHADRGDSRVIYAQVGQAFTLIGSLAFLGIMLYIDIVERIIGPEFREGIGVVPLLLLANLMLGLFYNFSIWYKLADRTRIGGYIALGGSIITLSLNFYLIPRIGYFGPAYAALACYGFMALTSYAIGQREHPIPYPILRMASYTGSAILLFLLSGWLIDWLPEKKLWWILGVNTLLFLVYLAFWYWLEKKRLLELVRAPN